MSAVISVTDETFKEEVEKHAGFALVDFWAEWCGPCKMLGPVVEEVAGEYRGRLKVVKCDTESSSEKAGEFGVVSIPCLILFNNGAEVDRAVGYKNKAQLKAWLNTHLPG